MTYDASDRKAIRRAEKSAKLADANRGVVLKTLASTAQGREYLWAKLSEAHIFSTPYSPDTNQTFFNLGEQNAGLRLLADIMQWCPEQFLEMMVEANGRRTTDTAIDDNRNQDAAVGERPVSEDAGGDVDRPGSEADSGAVFGEEAGVGEV